MTTGKSDGGLAKGRRFDRYEIREQIGQGGMGAVYRAVDSKLGRTVALKTVVAQHAGAQLTEAVRQRFLREALAISKIDHRNVVQVLDFGFTEDGTKTRSSVSGPTPSRMEYRSPQRVQLTRRRRAVR